MAKVHWTMSLATFHDYRNTCLQGIEAQHQQDSIRLLELVDHLQSLPGFPPNYDHENDLIVPVVELTPQEEALYGKAYDKLHKAVPMPGLPHSPIALRPEDLN
jgi:hypothetical protein